MKSVVKTLISIIGKKDWWVRVNSVNGFIHIEITDPSFILANSDILFIEVLNLFLHDYNYFSISQYVDEDQWELGGKQEFIQNMLRIAPVTIAFTRNYHSSESVQTNDKVYILNLIGPSKIDWIKEIIRFGMTSNPNIFYGFQHFPENWLSQITELNSTFRNWFELEGDISEFAKKANYVDFIGWTEDGHLNFALKGQERYESILGSIIEVAIEKGLTLRIDHN